MRMLDWAWRVSALSVFVIGIVVLPTPIVDSTSGGEEGWKTTDLAWSPGGDAIAIAQVSAQRSRILVRPLNGKRQRVAFTEGQGALRDLYWSSEGRWLLAVEYRVPEGVRGKELVSTLRARICVIPIAESSDGIHTLGVGYAAKVSRDESKLAYIHVWRPGGPILFVRSIDQGLREARRLTLPPDAYWLDHWSQAWSAGGHWLAAYVLSPLPPGIPSELAVISDSGQVRRVAGTHGANRTGGYAWSLAGDRLVTAVFSNGQSKVVEVEPFDGSPARTLRTIGDSLMEQVVYPSDVQACAFRAVAKGEEPRRRTYIASLTGDRVTELSTRVSTDNSMLRWSKDGSRLAVGDRDRVHVFDREGRLVRTLHIE